MSIFRRRQRREHPMKPQGLDALSPEVEVDEESERRYMEAMCGDHDPERRRDAVIADMKAQAEAWHRIGRTSMGNELAEWAERLSNPSAPGAFGSTPPGRSDPEVTDPSGGRGTARVTDFEPDPFIREMGQMILDDDMFGIAANERGCGCCSLPSYPSYPPPTDRQWARAYRYALHLTLNPE